MPPPPAQKCSVPDCPYETPENIPTWEMLTTHLNAHAQSVHIQPSPTTPTVSSKTAKKTRPAITPQMSEESWRFFIDEWERYKRQTQVKNQELLDELWSCMSDELRQLAFAEGGTTNLDTEAAMTTRIKSLAVVALHSSVHVVNLHELRQQSDENVHSFAARVRGIAASCNLQKNCSSCQTVVNFSEETCFHVVLAGICDQDMKERALTQAMMETITDLNSLVKWCTADESGRLGLPSQVSIAPLRQSMYKKLQKNKTCANCGAKRHGDGSLEARQKECKAFGKICSKCNKKNHFSSVCWSTKMQNPSTNAITTESEGNINGVLRFQAVCQAKKWWRPWENTGVDNVVMSSNTMSSHSFITKYSVSTSNRYSCLENEELSECGNQYITVGNVKPAKSIGTRTRPRSQKKPSQTKPPRSSMKTGSDLSEVPLYNAKYIGKQDSIPTQPVHLATMVNDMKLQGVSPVRVVPLPHMLHNVHEGWVKARPRRNPDVSVNIKLHYESYKMLGLQPPSSAKKSSSRIRPTKLPAITDTGAQMNVCPSSLLTTMNIQPQSIFPLQEKVEGASSEPIRLVGGIIVEISGSNEKGETISTLQLMYVSNAVKQVYLSLDTCVALQVLPTTFPQIGSCPPSSLIANIENGKSGIYQCTNTGIIQPGTEKCSCPTRELPPKGQAKLPCEATEENLPVMKEYILNRFASSAFNTCQRQPLPLMQGSPPLRLHVDPEAKPVAVHQPAQVPLHWEEKVKGALDRDVRLGVIEPVPVNTPSEWCSRMIIAPKPTGEPRRVVDYQNLNAHAPRQTHHTQTPWFLVSSIPPNQVKTVLDCFHGYHNIPIAEEDRRYTTFITPYGRYQYKTCPQGFLAAGDAYSHRMDLMLENTPRLKKCIDDSLLYDENIEANFYRVCEFLQKCSEQGCIFNPKKFQFGEKTVKFLGFNITQNSVTPTEDFLENIKSFPTPKTITDVRAWFGAVAQISYAFSTAPIMFPFRHLLSTKTAFQWSPELEKAFSESKLEIIRQCELGVKSFDPRLPTVLATDWSKQAMGLWLCQKHCACDSTKPGCCHDGWKTVYVSSRFCSPAESRYAPIEGEMLAAVWAMEKCRFFLLGMKEFLLALDHKPLIAMLGSQPVMTIPNPRLISMKMKSLMYSFKPIHIPGKLHVVPDSFSRRTDSPVHEAPTTDKLLLDTTNVAAEYANSCAPPAWVSIPTPGPAGVMAAFCTQENLEDPDIEQVMVGITMSALAALDEDPWQDEQAVHVVAPLRQQPVVLSMKRLEAAAATCPAYTKLCSFLQAGPPEDRNLWPDTLLPYYQHRHSLTTVGSIVLLHDRPVIPLSLRTEVLEHLHGAHHGVTTMYARAVTCVYWPNMREDIMKTRAACSSCNLNAPSNPAPPPHPVQHPQYPFSDICADFFSHSGKSFLVIVDRYSNWLSLLQLQGDTSANVIKELRDYFATWGIPHTFSTDGDSIFTSHEMKTWLQRWDVHHRISSAYYPRSNKRSEVAVKSGKRMIMDNLGPGGTLHTDHIARALLQHRNCPDTATGLSPAQVIFGRVLKDHLAISNSNNHIRPEWRICSKLREEALAQRHIVKEEQLRHGAKQLPALQPGDQVFVQDQAAAKQPGKWRTTGRVVEAEGFDSYLVKIHGSNRLTKRNRRFLRKIIPYNEALFAKTAPTPPPPSPTSTPHTTNSSPLPPVTQQPVAPVETPKSKKKKPLKEKWVLAKENTRNNDVIDTSEDIVSNTSVSPTTILPTRTPPPPPGTKHDYAAMDKEFNLMKEKIKASKVDGSVHQEGH